MKNNNFYNSITKKSFVKLLPYIIAISCTTLFFSSNFFPAKTKAYTEAKRIYTEVKEKRTVALEKLKAKGKGSKEYEAYLKEKIAADIAWEKLNEIKEEDKIFSFINIHQFLY